MVSELSIRFLFLSPSSPHPPPDGHCAGGTHPTGMHSFYSCNQTDRRQAPGSEPASTLTDRMSPQNGLSLLTQCYTLTGRAMDIDRVMLH